MNKMVKIWAVNTDGINHIVKYVYPWQCGCNAFRNGWECKHIWAVRKNLLKVRKSSQRRGGNIIVTL